MSETVTKRETQSYEQFLATYVTMAGEGKSAEEIGAAMGKNADYVTSTAGGLRASYRKQAVEFLKSQGIAEDSEKGKLVLSRVVEKVPHLKRKGRTPKLANEFAKELADLL